MKLPISTILITAQTDTEQSIYILRRGYKISCLTVHKYMNTELQLFSVTRKRKPNYEYCEPDYIQGDITRDSNITPYDAIGIAKKLLE